MATWPFVRKDVIKAAEWFGKAGEAAALAPSV